MRILCFLLWPVWQYHISPHYLINCTILGKKFPECKEGFEFLYDFCLNISHSENNSTRYYHKSMQVFIRSTCYSCQILIALEFSGQTF